jgi:serine/threonine protein kinase/tetratricopeptide (TPR) repeat protein
MATTTRTGQIISHYRIEDLLGSGGMGEVYRGLDTRLGRRIALKFVRPLADPSLRQRLVQEARAASRLDHPNICTIFEVDETEAGEIFIAMAYYDGETLDRTLSRGPLPAGRALSLAVQAARGLAAAHEELIVHRDVKPANLMIVRDDTIKILDFGLAKLMKDARITDPGSVIGTPAYMSPEQLSGRPADQRGDIWSLGAVLYEMVTGKPPFPGEGIAQVITAVLNEDPARASRVNPAVPQKVEKIIERALERDVRRRYDRMVEMVQDLADAQAALDPGAITRSFPVASARTSLAVLPFEDMSAGKDQEFLCDGIAEEILRALGRVPDLHVASRTSAFQFKHRSADIREIGAQLGVDAVLEGSVRRVADRVRISAQLINVRDGYRLWYERFDREIRDIFVIEDEIAEQIATALEINLDTEKGRMKVRRDTPYSDAYELYLQGRQFIHQHRRKTLEIALQLFSRAIDINPDFGRAYAGIADCHSFLRLYSGRGEESVVAADEASLKALELEPDLSDAHAARGFALFLQKEFEQAEVHLQRAIELDPRLYDPHYISGRLCFTQGRMKEAMEHFREACAIVPEAYDAWYLLGMCYRRLGEDARGRSADLECVEAAKRHLRAHPEDTRAWTMGAAVLAEMGEPDTAARWLANAMSVDPDEPIIVYNAACVYVRLGRPDEALDCLEVAFKLGAVAEWATNDPDLDTLRSNPRFQKLLALRPQ